MTTVSPPHTYVISLPRCTDRRQRIAARLGELKLSFSFFDAIEGVKLQPEDAERHYDGRRRRLFFGRDLTPSEVGCLLSHRAIYQKIVEDGTPLALILEDDALLGDDLPAVLTEAATLQARGVDFGLIRFLGNLKVISLLRPLRPIEEKPGHAPHALCRIYGTPGGAYGYIVTRDAAQRLLRATERCFVPIDVVHGEVWRTGIDAYALWPSPVLPDYEIESTMPPTRFQKSRQLLGWEKPAYPFTRMGYKVYEALFKNASALWTRLNDRPHVKRLGRGG